jgi:hypothetical protein
MKNTREQDSGMDLNISALGIVPSERNPVHAFICAHRRQRDQCFSRNSRLFHEKIAYSTTLFMTFYNGFVCKIKKSLRDKLHGTDLASLFCCSV